MLITPVCIHVSCVTCLLPIGRTPSSFYLNLKEKYLIIRTQTCLASHHKTHFDDDAELPLQRVVWQLDIEAVHGLAQCGAMELEI